MTNGTAQTSRQWWATPRTIIITVIALVVIALLAFRSKRSEGGGPNAKGVAAGGKAGGGAAGGGAPAMPPMRVDIDTARVQPIVDAVRATGHIDAVQAVELRPDEQGRGTALLCPEGTLVTRGA